MPWTGIVKTYNTNAQTPDSAGTATAMNTGYKTKAVSVKLLSVVCCLYLLVVNSRTLYLYGHTSSHNPKKYGLLQHSTWPYVYVVGLPCLLVPQLERVIQRKNCCLLATSQDLLCI